MEIKVYGLQPEVVTLVICPTFIACALTCAVWVTSLPLKSWYLTFTWFALMILTISPLAVKLEFVHVPPILYMRIRP